MLGYFTGQVTFAVVLLQQKSSLGFILWEHGHTKFNGNPNSFRWLRYFSLDQFSCRRASSMAKKPPFLHYLRHLLRMKGSLDVAAWRGLHLRVFTFSKHHVCSEFSSYNHTHKQIHKSVYTEAQIHRERNRQRENLVSLCCPEQN